MSSDGFCALMYHGILVPNQALTDLGTRDSVYTINQDRFETQLGILRDSERVGRSIGEIFANRSPEPCCAITFDDGNQSDISVALPSLLDNKFTATFYITTDWIGKRGFLNSSDIRALRSEGMEIGSHGHTHTYFDELTDAQLLEEVRASTDTLGNVLGEKVTALSAPGGRLHSRLGEIAAQLGIQTVGTSRVAIVTRTCDPLDIPRVAITSDTSDAEFTRIVSLNSRYFRRKKLRQIALNSAKRILGNHTYERLRASLLGDG